MLSGQSGGSTTTGRCCFLSVLFPWASQVVLEVKNPPASAGDIRDTGSIPGSGGSPGRGPGKTLQYSCLENPLDRGAWWATVHGVTKSWPRLKRLSTHALFPSRLSTPKTTAVYCCVYSPKACAGHAVSFQQMFVDLLMIKDGSNVRKEKKEESEKVWVLRTEDSYSLWTGKEVVTAELFLQENVLLSLIRLLWHWGENEKTWGWSKSVNQLHWL